LIHHVITFVKNEGNKLETMATTLNLWNIFQVYENICFGHVMFKICQYVTNVNKVDVGLNLVYLKDVQVDL
jgi:hypothetical protein